MDYKLHLNEHVGVSAQVRAETELVAVIYRSEYVKFRSSYLIDRNDADLIFTFIFLQIYVECFLHQNMRKIIELEFKPPRLAVYENWMKHEKRGIPEKVACLVELFQLPLGTLDLIKRIKSEFQNISKPRNKFAHGWKISSWHDSLGSSGFSQAKSLITLAKLQQTEASVDALAADWNQLLDQIQPQCKALRRLTDFKLQSLQE